MGLNGACLAAKHSISYVDCLGSVVCEGIQLVVGVLQGYNSVERIVSVLAVCVL